MLQAAHAAAGDAPDCDSYYCNDYYPGDEDDEGETLDIDEGKEGDSVDYYDDDGEDEDGDEDDTYYYEDEDSDGNEYYDYDYNATVIFQ